MITETMNPKIITTIKAIVTAGLITSVLFSAFSEGGISFLLSMYYLYAGVILFAVWSKRNRPNVNVIASIFPVLMLWFGASEIWDRKYDGSLSSNAYLALSLMSLFAIWISYRPEGEHSFGDREASCLESEMKNSKKLLWKSRLLRLSFFISQWISTCLYAYFIYLVQRHMDIVNRGTSPKTQTEGLISTLVLVCLIAIWSAPKRRIARWSAAIINILFVVMLVWGYVTDYSTDSFTLIVFIFMISAFPIFNIAVIWIGAKGGLEQWLMGRSDSENTDDYVSTQGELNHESESPDSTISDSVNETNIEEDAQQVQAGSPETKEIDSIENVELNSELKCSKCGFDLGSDFDFCPKCGEEVVNKVCSVCQKQIDISSTFCPFCGASTK